MKKKQILKSILTLFVLFSFALASLQAQNIYFKFSNSTYSQYPLSDIRKITFSASDMNLNMINGSTTSFPFSSISSFNYTGFDGSTGLNTPTKNSDESEVSIYPNPSNGTFVINYSENNVGEMKVDLIEMSGKLIQSVTQQQNVEGNYSLTLNLPVGIYVCRITTSEKTISKKIIITK